MILRFSALFINSLRKEYHNKTLVALAIFTLLVILGINGLFNMLDGVGVELPLESLFGQRVTILYKIITMWSGILGVILGINAISTDFEFNTAVPILATPLSKGEYLFARISAAWATATIYYTISILAGVLLFSQDQIAGQGLASVFYALLVNTLSILVMILWGVLFSLFLSRGISLLGALILSFITHLSYGYMANIAAAAANNPAAINYWSPYTIVASLLYYLTPQRAFIHKISDTLLLGTEASPLPAEMLLGSTHFFITSAILYGVVYWYLRRKSF
jgi:ABC-type transport system involved in multi-copper enzyme maturation permease subunit